jgi:hypothetical protein
VATAIGDRSGIKINHDYKDPITGVTLPTRTMRAYQRSDLFEQGNAPIRQLPNHIFSSPFTKKFNKISTSPWKRPVNIQCTNEYLRS